MSMATTRRKTEAAMTAKHLRAALRRLRLNQSEAAILLGINRRTLVRWLADETPITNKIAALLRVELGIR